MKQILLPAALTVFSNLRSNQKIPENCRVKVISSASNTSTVNKPVVQYFKSFSVKRQFTGLPFLFRERFRKKILNCYCLVIKKASSFLLIV